MTRTWNLLWRTLWDEESPADYVDSIRRIILASNEDTDEWFRTIVSACTSDGNDEPLFMMLVE